MVVFRILVAEKVFHTLVRRKKNKKQDCYLLAPPPPPSPLYHHLLHVSSFFFSYHCSSCHATANEFLYFIEYECMYVFVCFWWSKSKIQDSRNDWLCVAPLYPKGSIILGVAICCDGFITDLPEEFTQRTRVISCTYIFIFAADWVARRNKKEKLIYFKNVAKTCSVAWI